jgi:hypothetical protein
MLPHYDADGTCFPWPFDDAIAEAAAALTDPEAGDPAEWPEWTDEHTYELGPDDDTGEYPAVADDDHRPAADGPYEPTAEDLADYERWSARIDALMDLHANEEWADRQDTLARLHGAGVQS